MAHSKIKAIIFDCFGVLTTDGWLPFKQHHFGHDKSLFDEASDLNQQNGAGLISPSRFFDEIASMTNLNAAEARARINASVPDETLFDYIRSGLKPEYKIGMLSNAGGNMLDKLFTPDQIAVFDAVALSYEMGAVKPDKRAYHTICDRLGVSPGETIFVDDQERHCGGAREVGMQAIVYQDQAQLQRELTGLLGNTKN